MNDLENVSAIDNKIALIDLGELESKTCISFLSDDGWVQINNVTAIRMEKRPIQPKIYPMLKN